jgi:hypothetical protein
LSKNFYKTYFKAEGKLKHFCGWEGSFEKLLYDRPLGRDVGIQVWKCPECKKEIYCWDSTD